MTCSTTKLNDAIAVAIADAKARNVCPVCVIRSLTSYLVEIVDDFGDANLRQLVAGEIAKPHHEPWWPRAMRIDSPTGAEAEAQAKRELAAANGMAKNADDTMTRQSRGQGGIAGQQGKVKIDGGPIGDRVRREYADMVAQSAAMGALFEVLFGLRRPGN